MVPCAIGATRRKLEQKGESGKESLPRPPWERRLSKVCGTSTSRSCGATDGQGELEARQVARRMSRTPKGRSSSSWSNTSTQDDEALERAGGQDKWLMKACGRREVACGVRSAMDELLQSKMGKARRPAVVANGLLLLYRWELVRLENSGSEHPSVLVFHGG